MVVLKWVDKMNLDSVQHTVGVHLKKKQVRDEREVNNFSEYQRRNLI